MRGKNILLALCMLFCFSLPAFAQVNSDSAPLQFQDKSEEARFHALASELRCVMCQNQSLADSNALIALQLRREVLELMRKGILPVYFADSMGRYAAGLVIGALLGVAAGVGAGMAMAAIFGVLALTLMANQVASGLALAIFGVGLAAFVGKRTPDFKGY